MSIISRREIVKLGAISGIGAILGPGCSNFAMIADSSLRRSGTSESKINTRMLWTWDHSTEWALNHPGSQTIGSCNEYSRTTDVFLDDYSALFHWCGRHNIDAVVIWGLLRDSHGGLEAAKRLCDVALREGVRLLCGVGLNAYGGVYYEGDSPYNLERHLREHPELYAVDAKGNSINFCADGNGNRVSLSNTTVPGPRGFYHACPSRPENKKFIEESLLWLFKNLPLGGAQIETGDTGVCQCELCRERRQYPVSDFSWEDMALVYPLATNAIRSVSPDAWVVCETYSHPQPYDAGPNRAPRFGYGKPPWADVALAAFPRGVFVQWVADRYLRENNTALVWDDAGRVSGPDLHHVIRAHFGTDWGWGGFRGELAVDWIIKLVKQSTAAGINAISLFGEVSPFHTGAELNYLALQDLGSISNPSADRGVFDYRISAPLLGGKDRALQFFYLASLLDRSHPENLKLIAGVLPSVYANMDSLSPDASRRWCWLANELATYVQHN